MTGSNFTCRVWIAFDASSSTSPTWVEITTYVKQEADISISHGRGDTLSDVGATTCTLTVDNTDGRFLAANKSGPWYGQIHKGNWLKVEITPPSGTVSQRFVGFITSLPDQWLGDTQLGQITASDRFEKLQGATPIISSIQSEVLTDPNLTGNVLSYWNLHEASSGVYGQITFGDTSGNLSQPLTATALGGVPLGTGMGVANAAAPGFDGLKALTFNPTSSTQGTYLTGTVVMPPASWDSVNFQFTGNFGTLELWFQATTTGVQQYLAAIIDPVAQFGFSLWVDATGYLNVSVVPTSAANTHAGWNQAANNNVAFPRVDDGTWHHIVLGVLSTSASSGWTQFGLILDGKISTGVLNSYAGAGNNLSQLIIGGGYTSSRAVSLGAANLSDVAWTWSPLQNSTLVGGTASTYQPDYASHAAAGLSGFLGESTDLRIARVARYAGVPIPLTVNSSPALGLGPTKVYSQAQGPWTNLSVGAHYCGTQSMSGRKPLDVMLEAAHTENMPLYVNRAGYLEMQASTSRQNTTPAWTIDSHDMDPSTRSADDFAYTTNQMVVTPNGQAAQTVIGAAGSAGRLSQAKYDVKDGSQSTASLNPVEAQSLGLGIIQLRADPPPRLSPLAFEASTTALLPGYGNAWYDAVLATEISTPARVTNAPSAVGGGNYDCLIEGWTETITSGQHLFQFNVSAVQGPTYQLDDAVLGRLDTDGTTLVGALNTTATTFTAAVATATSAAWTVSSDFPFDILMDAEQMTVTSIAPVSMGVDGTFESSASGWTLSGCTLVQSTVQAHSGTHSGLMTATTTGAVVAVTPQFAVYPNATYQPSHWFYLASGAPNNDLVTVSWYTSGAVLISSVASPYVLTPQSFWRQQAFPVTAPSNAAFATVKIQFTSAASGNAIYIDDAVFTLLTGGQQQFTVTRSVNGVVASHTSGASLALAESLTLAY